MKGETEAMNSAPARSSPAESLQPRVTMGPTSSQTPRHVPPGPPQRPPLIGADLAAPPLLREDHAPVAAGVALQLAVPQRPIEFAGDGEPVDDVGQRRCGARLHPARR